MGPQSLNARLFHSSASNSSKDDDFNPWASLDDAADEAYERQERNQNKQTNNSFSSSSSSSCLSMEEAAMEAAARRHVASLEREANRSSPFNQGQLQSWSSYMSDGKEGELDDDSPWASIDAIADGISSSALSSQIPVLPGSQPRFSSSPPSTSRPSSSHQSSAPQELHTSEEQSSPISNAQSPTPILTHVNNSGQAGMVDVSSKLISLRSATATCKVRIPPLAASLLQASEHQASSTDLAQMQLLGIKVNFKGPVLQTAKLAGIMAAKRTSELIPLCHSIALSHVDLELKLQEPTVSFPHYHISISCTATTSSQTGVEMEALTGVNISAVTIWDMLKSVAGKEMVIEDVKVVRKSGGKSGDWERDEEVV